ncbi:hypothetical protein GGR57DRAFT_505802 [Xylariaceae sp. FL1272]|nr:hypothetical protein GGR57DRAFT_505802 [Xylariaceae sp. FL1272]
MRGKRAKDRLSQPPPPPLPPRVRTSQRHKAQTEYSNSEGRTSSPEPRTPSVGSGGTPLSPPPAPRKPRDEGPARRGRKDDIREAERQKAGGTPTPSKRRRSPGVPRRRASKTAVGRETTPKRCPGSRSSSASITKLGGSGSIRSRRPYFTPPSDPPPVRPVLPAPAPPAPPIVMPLPPVIPQPQPSPSPSPSPSDSGSGSCPGSCPGSRSDSGSGTGSGRGSASGSKGGDDPASSDSHQESEREEKAKEQEEEEKEEKQEQ